MEITRDNLIAFVNERLTAEGLSVAELERRAGVPKDTIRDFQRGKTYILRADKYQKVMRVLAPGEPIF